LQAELASGRIAREGIFITTKLWNTNHRPERVEPAFEASLKRIGLDYLDLYLIHTPFAFQPGDEQDPRDQDGRVVYDKGVTLLDTWKAMENLVDRGRCRAIGKRETGPSSRYIVDATQAGDMFETSAPRGDFVLRSGLRPVVLLSAGIGVTPVLCMLHALAAENAGSPREVWWIHAARNAKEHVFIQESRQLLSTIPESRSIIAYSKPDPTDRHGKDFDIQGHLDLAGLQGLGIPVEADFYICGPTGFLGDMNRFLISLGVPPDGIRQEIFGPASSVEPGVVKAEVRIPHLPLRSSGNGPVISFTRSVLAVPWDNKFKSLLELAEACDVPVRWSCRSGVCHMCECGLLSGKLHYSPEPLDEPATGNALICVTSESLKLLWRY